MFDRIIRPKKHSTWRGFLAGLLSHYLSVFILIVLFYILRPFLWTAIYGSPDWRSTGPVDPASTEGFILQTLGSLGWLPAGAAALHWGGASGMKSVALLFIYMVVMLAVGVFGGIGNVPSFSAAPWYWFSAPTGLLVGVAFFRWKVSSRARHQPLAAERHDA